MKINTVFRIIYNKFKFFYLKKRSKGKLQVDGVQFFNPSSRLIVGKGEIILGRSLMVEKNCYFSASSGGKIEIGERTFFNRNCYVAAREKILIGSDCNFGPNVSIYDHDHKFDINGVNKNEYKTSVVTIGNNCWIGDGVKILRGTTIGDGCVIGAGAIIKKNIPAHSIVKNTSNLVILDINN